MDEMCEMGEAARAMVKVAKVVAGETLTLCFCKHHYEKSADVLVLSGWRVVRDERPTLVVTP